MLEEIFTGNLFHNERILDAFILEKDAVFAEEDKSFSKLKCAMAAELIRLKSTGLNYMH